MPRFDEIEGTDTAPSFDGIELDSAPSFAEIPTADVAPSFAAIKPASDLEQLGEAPPVTPQPFMPGNANIRAIGQDSYGPLQALGSGLSWLGEKGRGLANAGYDWARENDTAPMQPAREAVSRAGLSMLPFMGPKLLDEAPPGVMAKGISQMDQTIGRRGTEAVMIGSGMVAQAPQFLVGFGWAQRGAQAAQSIPAGGRVLPKILEMAGGALGAGAEGAVQNAALAASQGENPAQAAKSGFLFGAGIHGAGSASSEVVRAMRNAEGPGWSKVASFLDADLKQSAKKGVNKVGMLVGDAIDRLADEVGFLRDTGPEVTNPTFDSIGKSKVEASVQHAAENARDHSTVGLRVRPGDLTPSVILVHTTPEGNLLASVNEIRSDGTRKFYEMPLDTPEEAYRVGSMAKSRKLSIGISQGAKPLLFDMAPEMAERLLQREGRPLAAKDSNISGTRPDSPRSFPDLDSPPRTSSPNATVRVDSSGHVKLEVLEDHVLDLDGLPDKGEAVFILDGAGTRHPGIYHGVDSVTGKAVVSVGHDLDNMGSIREVGNAQIVRAPPEDVGAVDASPAPFSKRGEAPRVLKKGDQGFVANPEGGYFPVRVRGVEPGNKLRVSFGPGNERVVDASKVDARFPPGVQSLDDVLPAQPDAPPPVTQDTLSLEDHEAVQGAKRLFEYTSKQGTGAWQKITNALLGGQVRGAKAMREIHLRNQGSQALHKAEADVLRAVGEQLPKGPQRESFRNDLTGVALGRKAWPDMVKKYGEGINEQLKVLTGNLSEVSKIDDLRIAELDGIPDSLIHERGEGLIDPYLARGYMVHVLPPGEWAKRVPAEKFQRAVEFLVQDLSQNGKLHVFPEQVAAELETLLKSGNVAEAIKSSGLKGSSLAKHLVARKEIPVELREVMGEITQGDIRMAMTFGTQKAIIAKLELFQDIANNPEMSSIGRRADLYPEPVPDVKRLYGKLAGKYVTPEIYKELINLPQTIRNTYALSGEVANWIKGNQLSGFGPWWTSLMGNLQGSMLSGGINVVTRPMEAMKDIRQALQAMKDYHTDPSGRTGDGYLMLEAKKMGSDFAGRGEVEINAKSRKFVNELLKAVDGKGPFSFINVTKKAIEKYNDGTGSFSEALDVQDRFFRMANWLALRRRAMARGAAPKEAGLEAARMISKRFPNPGNLGTVPTALRGQVGIAAPYLTPKAEEMRILTTAAVDMIPGHENYDPALMFRIAAHAIFFGGVGKMLMHLSGITDEEVAAAKASMTKRQQTYKTAMMPLPVRDALGRVQLVDVSNYFLPAQILQGHPDDSPLGRVTYNIATYPFEGSMFKGSVDAIAEQGGLKRPSPPAQLLEGEGNVTKMIDKLYQMGFGPRYRSTLGDIARRTDLTPLAPQMPLPGTQDNLADAMREEPVTPMGNLRTNEEPWTMGQAAANMMGVKVQGFGDRSHQAQVMEFVNELQGLKGQYRRAAKSGRNDGDKERIYDAITDRMQRLGLQQEEVDRLLQEADITR